MLSRMVQMTGNTQTLGTCACGSLIQKREYRTQTPARPTAWSSAECRGSLPCGVRSRGVEADWLEVAETEPVPMLFREIKPRDFVRLDGQWLRVGSRTATEISFDSEKVRLSETHGLDGEYRVRRPS
ncbi:hypothetical protein SEA_NEOBUSH_38 [Gordonia phage Neobush]|uniref:Uncharacterized protein n=9 Tax=Nymphadoravirus TaxID=2169636 RepID=A0A4Y5U0K1_9CAUD|nr:hypothetical protein SEA_KITA_39 [Gordonia phage Kita]YP_010653069.1 hypothetical protein PP489_gp35 [Gordonia phage Polly]YP_010653148.1 hypothetical protein PP490_gp38 [Gordonia phage Maridalia]QCG77457.1 hypothetical protein SEA_ANTONIO_38 [Gordonia phage Antonio]QCW22481.1 hypothetical protein SEA_TAYONIA_38 [Gordonia phage Tayonia]QDF16519.1 hypothetical protein SEA_ZAMEEN_38 [Gordonia phage Zameen]QDH48864.1 hypothetical protein SEA_SUSCEPIT_38 [Gordonia phage Suscepit]QUE26145.1 hy